MSNKPSDEKEAKIEKPAKPAKAPEFLRSLLDANGTRQKDLAQRLDVSPAYVSAVVSGQKSLSAETATRMSAALNLSHQDSVRLHRAAAQDMGFNLELPDDF